MLKWMIEMPDDNISATLPVLSAPNNAKTQFKFPKAQELYSSDVFLVVPIFTGHGHVYISFKSSVHLAILGLS